MNTDNSNEQSLADRRADSRFDVLLHGVATTQDGQKSFIQICNISSSGLQFAVDQAEMVTMLPNKSEKNTLKPVSIKLKIHLDQKNDRLISTELESDRGSNTQINQSTPLEINCGIVYIKRKSIDQCIVGCRFENFCDDSDERLESYLLKQS